MIKCAMFDLDGTLVNTIEDLARAAAFTVEQLGYNKKWSMSDYTSFVGNGAKLLVSRSFDNTLDEEQLENALEVFKKKYQQILLDNAYAYDGIKESLEYIKQQGIYLAVVTNKPHKAAVKMVEEIFGRDYFDVIVGAVEDKPKKPDRYMPSLALSKLQISGDEVIFFGDSDVDIKTARAIGACAVACSWGYRSEDSLKKAVPDAIIYKPIYIKNFFEKNC